jgi:UDP-glucose 4,6-dehydratase
MRINKIFITGAAGFIGSHLSEFLFKNFPESEFILFDKLTYAANIKFLNSIINSKRVKFIKADLVDYDKLLRSLKNVDLAINAAAESHVDNSFGNSLLFTKTNTLGTHCFLEACRVNKVKKIIHVSTDEVYGQNLGKPFEESRFLNPTNPYSASKAGADMLVNSYVHSFKIPIITVRANNIFGTRQYPEKLISKTIYNLINKKKMTIHGKGNYYRYYLSVYDFCDAILILIKYGKNANIYNIGANKCFKITTVVKIICKSLKKNFKKNVKYIKTRPFNDKVYKVSSSKLRKLNWNARRDLRNEINEICQWYLKNFRLFK